MPVHPFPDAPRTRIAPTPSGLLHAGNGAAFVLTSQLARDHGGHVLLRIDDIDVERVRKDYVQDVFDTLAWLKVKPDAGPKDGADLQRNWSQQLRLPSYQALLDQLAEGGHLFACTCSRKDLASCRCRQQEGGLEDPEATWRLRVPEGRKVSFQGWPQAPRAVDLYKVMPDPVLRQRPVGPGSTGRPAYQVASLADDVHFGIDLVVRGNDLLPSTACQVYLAELLGLGAFTRTTFIHHALLADERGGKLSKSQGAGSLRAMREQEEGPELILGLAHYLRQELGA